ncbi:cytochrome c oxidase assembly protein [Sphaerisporangium krabiense]|uniref:Putative membrane protein n=1 Tax=Sphaerisporangium krabiense TaxID=763782 RepID=A0A7W8Z7V7_9ACTN|nr:cytochrome c oxidase assembly protein [Sphaerisporangium krabiense]MBB5628969.1 putative membrane protein [Sphaerisporangium krabiense]
MSPVHGTQHGGDGWTTAAAALVIAMAALYLAAAAARRAEPRGWSGLRTACFAAGAALLAAGLLPPVAAFAAHDFRGHMLQHLLIGMLAPLGLVLGAPVTLLLRSLPPRDARVVGRVLRGRAAHVLAGPWAALALSVGGMAALYATPLYGAVAADPLLHHLLHAHFVLSGCLFAWAIAGPDPAPRRPPVPHRLVVLGVAVAAHATVAQLMYAGLLPLDVPAAQLRGAAEIMYYGGDAAELLLALAMVATWRPARRRVPVARPA